MFIFGYRSMRYWLYASTKAPCQPLGPHPGSHLQDVRRESVWAAHLQFRARNKQETERLHWKQMSFIGQGFPTIPLQALFICLYYFHFFFLLHDCSQLFMMGICAYFKCANAHLNTPMCYVVLCVQCFIKIAPTKD